MKALNVARGIVLLTFAAFFLQTPVILQAQSKAPSSESTAVASMRDFAAPVKQATLRLAQSASATTLPSPQANSAAPVAPAQNATVKYFSAAEVHAAFEKGSPLIPKDGHNYSVSAGRREKPGQSELHEKDTDVFYIMQGTAIFVTGGKMLDAKTVAPGEVRGSGIEGGQSQVLSKDDVIVIPAGVPHWFKDVQGTFLYFVVKAQ